MNNEPAILLETGLLPGQFNFVVNSVKLISSVYYMYNAGHTYICTITVKLDQSDYSKRGWYI